MLRLGVNIDHVATLRQARYRDEPDNWRAEPDPVAAALEAERAGCHGITAHLREDRRHIVDRDLPRLRAAIKTRLNLEIAAVSEIVEIALAVKPHIVCIVPERRSEVTTEGGLDVVGTEASLHRMRQRLNDGGIEVSLFIDPDPAQVEASIRVGAQAVELHTGRYADRFRQKEGRNVELQRLVASARQAHAGGLIVNAGHGLTTENVPVLHIVPHLNELNIGHTLISRGLFVGLERAVQEMLRVMDGYPG
ncbi:MAG TPA: pyridoxine 5'-phosphate synthase [Verrucomicrobiota bacterium]|nr:pyridoxine 5'-phosphate synthase [Verrucomicrobiales bacterium]HRI16127.1 pyridoxine 5'-phosphate synthase [Verrucomicrobiota bacterium]